MIDLTMLFVGEIWKNLRFLTRIVVRHLKWGLMRHSFKSMEDSTVHDLYCKGHLKTIQRGRLLESDLEIICSYDILAKNVVPFCPCLKKLPEAKLQSFR